MARLAQLRKLKNISSLRLTVFVGCFVAAGIIMLLLTHAQTPNSVGLEPEQGQLAGGTTSVASTTASAGAYAQFSAPASGTTYYVGCNGNDANNGTSQATAWKTIGKANQATLQPGDSLLLKRGCTFTQQLTANWTGTSAKPITIDAYGSGNAPLIQRNAGSTTNVNNSNFVGVSIGGSYQNLSNLAAQIINPNRNTSCTQSDGSAIPYGWYPDFYLSGNHNTLSYLDGTLGSTGIAMGDTATNNKLLHNHLHNLHYFWSVSASTGALGAIGILLHGDNNEIAYNQMDSNGASCSLSGSSTAQIYNAPFEVYNANNNYVHHNQAYGHIKHFEMGSDSTHTTDNNVLAYNLFVSSQPNAVGPNIHGTTNPFGPVTNTYIYNNTFVFTGANSQAIVCDCDGTGGATIRNNILVAEWKSAYYHGTITESNNLYWDFQQTTDSQPDPFVQFNAANISAISASSMKVNPVFVNNASDFHLQATSPAIDHGTTISSTDSLLLNILKADLDNKTVPQGSLPDIGAYEH